MNQHTLETIGEMSHTYMGLLLNSYPCGTPGSNDKVSGVLFL